MWKLIFAFVLSLLVFQACSQKPSPQDSCHFVTNSDQQRVSWHRHIPVQMQIDANSVNETYLPAITSAMEVWNQQLGVQVFDTPSFSPVADRPEADGLSTIYFVAKDWFGTPDEQARTSIYYTGNQIYEADIRINTQDFSYVVNGAPSIAAKQLDLVSLVVHELGHVLGLAHIQSEPSVMAKDLDFGQVRSSLYAIDVKSVRCEY